MSSFRNLIRGLILLFSCSTLAQHKNVFISPYPEWVKEVKVNLSATLPEEEATGHYYLLLDDQHFLKGKEFYSRYTYKILNSKGVQDMADLNINFDPEYQTAHLHKINIIRNGKVIEKLDLKQLTVIQMETNRERFLYDGRLTIIANLTDVRVGDIVDYSYTIKGSNPIYAGNYQSTFALQYNLPVQKIHYSITVPPNETINFRGLNGAPDPEIISSEFGEFFSWEVENVQSVNYDYQAPPWFDPTPLIQVTQFDSWGEVVDKFQPHYTRTSRDRKILDQKFIKIIDSNEQGTKFIDRAIRFVQDEVRYLGFQNGMNSHKPSDPNEVLERRYGDCKDKSFLLSEILQARGISAYPMLVHSSMGKNLDSNLPSPDNFDHCVVEIDLGKGNYRYVDPTISDQGGSVENMYFPNYGFGLVLKPGETQLRKLPEYREKITDITETFELDDLLDGGAFLEVKTIYRGRKADLQREEFSRASRQNILDEYTAFYKNLYPSIKPDGNLTLEDNREENSFIVYEKYRIDSLWEEAENYDNILQAEFFPLSLQSYLNPEISIDRKIPFQVGHMENIVHKTVVYVPEVFNIENESVVLNNDDFIYSYDTNYKNARLEITHSYNALSSHIQPENIGKYLEEHSKARENLSYALTYNPIVAASLIDPGVSWWIIIFTLLILGGSGYLALKIYNEYDIPTKVKPGFEKNIGGWLVLIAIGLTLTPIVVLSEFLFDSEYFSKSTWSILFSTSENYTLAFYMLFELIFNSIFLIFSILVVVLFFKKRTIAPRLIIIFMAVTLLIAIIDSILGIYFSPIPATGPEKQEFKLEIIKKVIQCLIWIPYFIYSRRVEETFTKTRKPLLEEAKQEEEIPELIATE